MLFKVTHSTCIDIMSGFYNKEYIIYVTHSDECLFFIIYIYTHNILSKRFSSHTRYLNYWTLHSTRTHTHVFCLIMFDKKLQKPAHVAKSFLDSRERFKNI